MISYLQSLDYGAIFTGMGVLTALLALNTWKKQVRLSRQTAYLDELVDDLFRCVTEFQTSIEMFKHLRNAVWAESSREWGDTQLSVEDVKNYYRKSEEQRRSTGKSGVRQFLQDSLDAPIKIRSKLYALRNKGIMHSLYNYETIAEGISQMIFQIETLEKVSQAISMSNINLDDKRLQGNIEFIANRTDVDLREEWSSTYKTLMIQIKINFDDIIGSRTLNRLRFLFERTITPTVQVERGRAIV